MIIQGCVHHALSWHTVLIVLRERIVLLVHPIIILTLELVEVVEQLVTV